MITLREPPKAALLPYLEAERLGEALPKRPPREAKIQFFRESSNYFFETVIDLDDRTVYDEKDLTGYHSYTDFEEQTKLEQTCLRDQRVLQIIERLDLPEGAVVSVEPWTYAPDGEEDMTGRLTMVRDPL